MQLKDFWTHVTMRTHVTMVFAWNESTDIFLYCAVTVRNRAAEQI